jgi:hypothetical protein
VLDARLESGTGDEGEEFMAREKFSAFIRREREAKASACVTWRKRSK